jgi:EAL domain-containing protein (putative c-di-GMP-specific phosphodiesterase class I)
MENTDRTIECLQGLKRRGVQISIDDFGTGYSSLAYLRRFPVDKLKIDMVFVRNLTTSPPDAAIALAIIGMAHSLKLEVVAEGVETAEQLSYLRSHRCDQIQGYYFSKPLSATDLETLVRAKKRLPGSSTMSLPQPVMAVAK